MKLTYLGKTIISFVVLFSLFPQTAADFQTITEAITHPNMINNARSHNGVLEKQIFPRSVSGELKAIAILVEFPDQQSI